MDTAHSILRSAKYFFAGTALSRLSGFVRDISMAFCFGAAPEVAAFMVAYRLANLFRRFFGEGNLQSGFVPQFETIRRENQRAAFCFYRDSAYSLALALSLFILVSEGLLWCFLDEMPVSWREIARLTMWMIPGLLFICLSALNTAFLQCQKKYFAPAAAPILFNGVWIASVLLVHHFPLADAIRYLSIGVAIAFAVQWGATMLYVRTETRAHLAWKVWLQPHYFSPEWRGSIKPMALGLLGVGAVQINSAFDAVFARIADVSGPTYLWYAIRVQQLPLALFGIAISGALLPPLSRAMQNGDRERYCELLSSGLRQTAALMVPCTFGIFALGASGLNLLYGRGHFSSGDLQETLYCLWAYGVGLVPAAFVLLLSTGCYAKKSYGFPAFASLASVGVNLICNALFVFVFHWGAVSIALATSGGAWLNFAFLYCARPETWNCERAKTARIVDRKLNREAIPGFWRNMAKVTSAGTLAALLSIGCGRFLGDGTLEACLGISFPFSRVTMGQMAQFTGMGIVFAGSFLAIAKLFRIQEVFALFKGRSPGTSRAETF